MKSIILATAILAIAAAAVLPEEPIKIISQQQEVNPDGSFSNSYETANGIKGEEHGVLKNPGVKDVEAEEVQGSVSYKAPDGTAIHLTYVANENGFQPQGDHLPVTPVDNQTPPTPPPVPVAIARALKWIAEHPSKESQAS